MKYPCKDKTFCVFKGQQSDAPKLNFILIHDWLNIVALKIEIKTILLWGLGWYLGGDRNRVGNISWDNPSLSTEVDWLAKDQKIHGGNVIQY